MSPAADKKKRRWKLIVTIFTFVALAILIYAVRDQIADTIKRLKEVNTWPILLMIPLQIINYDAYTRMYRDILVILNEKISYWKMYGVQLELNFVNHILPSGGVSGFSYFSVRMRDHGIAAGKSTLVQFMRFILIFISFQILLVLGVFMLAFSGQVNNFVLLIAGSLITLMVVLTLLIAYIVGSKNRIRSFSAYITRIVNRLIHLVRRNNPETISIERVLKVFTDLHENYLVLRRERSRLKTPLYTAFAANITEILTLYVVFIAFGQWVNPGAVILAYAIASFAGLISILPAGVGIYEFLMTTVLAFAGVPPAISLPVIVMYRIISMTIQLVPGYILYYRNLHKKDNTQDVQPQ